MPELTQDHVEHALNSIARIKKLPYNPFSGEDQPARWHTAWEDHVTPVIQALIAAEGPSRTGYLSLNPMELETIAGPDFQLLTKAIKTAAEEARYK